MAEIKICLRVNSLVQRRICLQLVFQSLSTCGGMNGSHQVNSKRQYRAHFLFYFSIDFQWTTLDLYAPHTLDLIASTMVLEHDMLRSVK